MVVLLDRLVRRLRAGGAGGAELAPAEEEEEGGQQHQDDRQEHAHHHNLVERNVKDWHWVKLCKTNQGWEDFFRFKTNAQLIRAPWVGHCAAVITKIIARCLSEISSALKAALYFVAPDINWETFTWLAACCVYGILLGFSKSHIWPTLGKKLLFSSPNTAQPYRFHSL